MNIEGKVVQHLELVTGEGAKGQWSKQEFIIETEGDYPKKVCICLFGKVIESLPTVGSNVNVSVNVDSREYNGRWYTNINAWKVEVVGELKKPPQNEGDSLPF